MAGPISEWQQRLELEGSVTFRRSVLRNLLCFVGSLLFVGIGFMLLLGTDGASWTSWWGVAIVVSLGLCAVAWGRALVAGAPTLTVTRTRLTRSGSHEVTFDEIHEVFTNKHTFGFTWIPGPSDVLRGAWQRNHGLKYASVQADGAADSELLAQWVLRLTDPSGEIVNEPRYAGTAKAWRLSSTGA